MYLERFETDFLSVPQCHVEFLSFSQQIDKTNLDKTFSVTIWFPQDQRNSDVMLIFPVKNGSYWPFFHINPF